MVKHIHMEMEASPYRTEAPEIKEIKVPLTFRVRIKKFIRNTDKLAYKFWKFIVSLIMLSVALFVPVCSIGAGIAGHPLGIPFGVFVLIVMIYYAIREWAQSYEPSEEEYEEQQKNREYGNSYGGHCK